MKNCFYFLKINSIGGIESFFYYLAKKYQDWDITIYYKIGDAKQIRRLKKYVRVKKYNGEKIVCDRMFFNFNLDIIDNVQAKEYIQIAHGDYKAMSVKPNLHPKLTGFLGVSKQVCDTYKEVTGFETKLVYNPIEVRKPQKVLNIISATRLTSEKGKNRMIKLMQMLDSRNIPYIWTIFTDDTKVINNPNIAYMKPRLDITDFIANADYLVQLSDNEGYCYSVIESLSVGTPVIVTPCPVFKELGVENGKNGWIVDFNMSNVPIDDIYKGLPKFEYKPKESNWEQFLVKGKSTYKEEMEMKVKVKANRDFTLGAFDEIEDLERNNIDKNEEGWIYKDDTFTCDKNLYEYLNGDNPRQLKVVDMLEEIKEKAKEEKKAPKTKKPKNKKKN